jgi:nicotinate-nucleotide--dimethylbenzimidazole phosphoribosyltransferase
MPDLTLPFFRDCLTRLPAPFAEAIAGAEARNAQLTKPPGSLGRLEVIAIWLAGWQGTDKPRIIAPQIAIFAGNHGVVAKGVSAFPAEVTALMVTNFAHGGAAINQLARNAGAKLTVQALDLDHPTADFSEAPAMSVAELEAALAAGWNAVEPGTDLLVVGEMGIGNTTSAAAIAAALLGVTGADWVGRGTGVDAAGLARKAAVVQQALDLHRAQLDDPLEVLRRLGGREVAAMTGAILAARMSRVPVLLDGFIASAAAAVLFKAAPGALDHVLAAHASAEAAHGKLLAALGKEPLLAMGLRLGEGSGAALAIPLVRAAAECQSGMVTFAEAGITGG